MQKIANTISLSYYNSLINSALTDTAVIDYEKAGFKINKLRASIDIPEGKISSDSFSLNNKGVSINENELKDIEFSKTDSQLSIRMTLGASELQRNLNFLGADMEIMAIEEDSYAEKVMSIGDYGYLHSFINPHDVPVYITHCTSISLDSSKRRSKVFYYNEEANFEGIVGTIVYPGEKLNIPYNSTYAKSLSTFIVYKKVTVISKTFKTNRSISKRIYQNSHTQRTTTNQLKAFRIRIRRHIVSSSVLNINNILRKITKSKLCKPKTSRLIISSSLKTIRAKRKTCIKVNKRIYTNRKVHPGYEPITIWLDTKLTTLNTIKSKGPITRLISNNAQTSIPNTLRPIVYVYKLNDGHPITLSTSRTIHKSINNNINTLRRIDHDFYYTTTLSTSRSTSSSSYTSINSIRQVLKGTSPKINSKRQLIKNYNLYSDTLKASSIYANGSILTIRTTSLSNNLNITSNRQIIDYGHSKLNTIRRISKDNCICCNALTNRKVINDFSTAFNTTRTATTTNEANINTNRLIAINYISGYAFTNRCIITPTINHIDSYRYITNKTNPKLASLRKTTIFDWFYNPTARYIVNEANRSYLTNRKVVSDIFVSQDTSRSIYNKIELNLDNNREIVKSIDRDIDVKRNVAGEVSKEIDVTKKVVEKYIYLNKGQRQIIKSIKQDIDSYRETNKLLIANIDTLREVKSENIADTLCIDFIFKHGNLYEIDRSFYKAK